MKLRNLLAVLGVLVLAATFAALIGGPLQAANSTPPASSVPVTIVSPLSNGMVAVTGSTTISNTASTPLFVRDVDNPARYAFASSMTVNQTNSTNALTIPTTFQGKAVQMAVIEGFTAQCFSPQTEADINVTTNGVVNTYAFPAQTTSPSTSAIPPYQIRIYSDPGSQVSMVVGGTCAMVTISGHYVTQ